MPQAHASSVQLQWDANTETDLAGYKVYHNVASSPLAGTVPLDVSNQTTATISGLDPDKAYSFAVTAYNTSGVESSFSNIVTLCRTDPADSRHHLTGRLCQRERNSFNQCHCC